MQAERQPSIGQHDIDPVEGGGNGGDGCLHGGAVAHIERNDVAVIMAKLVAQGQQPVLAATGCDHLAAGGDVAAGGGGAETRGGTGDEDNKAAGIKQRIHDGS